MPAKNSIKQYAANSYYHLYNRGVEKRLIFLEQQDYAVFLSYLKDYLLSKNEKELQERLLDENINSKERDKILKLLRLNNFADEITLLAYCLMPNHFHFFVKQKSAGSIDKFVNSLGTRYTMYFNRKYDRVGSLYQGVYKAVSITNEPQFIYLTKYIHRQALASQGEALRSWVEKQPCSYSEYLGIRKTAWVHPEEVLGFFSKSNPSLSYQAFVEETEDMGNIHTVSVDEH